MTNEEIFKNLFKRAEELKWTITHKEGNIYDFAYAVDTQIFHIEVDTEGDPEKFLDNLYEMHYSFDISREAYSWLDETGRGKNGAPENMRQVYDNTECFAESILDTYLILNTLPR